MRHYHRSLVSAPHRAVFLDRDGVLNRAVIRGGRPFSPPSEGEVEMIEGVEAACQALKAAGFLLICVTNQPDIARRTRTRAEVEAINEKIKAALGLDDIRMCPHDDGDGCACRKPKPGLLLDAAKDFDIDLKSSIMVGDRWRDVEAGKQAGSRTVFVDYGYAEERPVGADFTCSGLAGALAWITGSPNGS